MKFTALRRYIKNKLSTPHELGDCDLVIYGYSYFKNTYKDSGCQFILGPECDRYANYIKKKLSIFLDNNVKCYVIFNGAAKHDLEKTKEIHQSIIDDRNDFARVDQMEYFQPLLINDVQKQVLNEMNIKYFVCEYDSIGAIVGVAKKLKCPVLTNNIEYSLFGVSCIPPNSVLYDNSNTKIKCKIYEQDNVRTSFGVYNKMPILLALLNESGDYLEKLSEIIENGDSEVIWPVIRWVKRQRETSIVSIVSNSNDNDDQKKAFKEVYEKIQTIYLFPLSNLAVKYFQRNRAHGLFKDDKKWFAKGVSGGRIAVPYVNLKKQGVVCGSLLINDIKRPDALLAAFDIIVYSHCLLTNSQDSTITFVGRKGKRTTIKEIDTHWEKEIFNRDIFTKHRVGKKIKCREPEVFELFLKEVLPGYDYEGPLQTVPEECWMLIITLVYYIFKKNKDFIYGAYCVLLSYFMLCQSHSVPGAEDSVNFHNGLQFLFDKVDLMKKYNSTLVHNLAEFQHCLQHMNYLNKLCGEKIPCTVYHKTFNATFIYNTFLFMEDKHQFMKFLKNKFEDSNTLKLFKNIVSAFENCLSVVKVFSIK